MSEICVIVKRPDGIVLPCHGYPERDGYRWHCANCEEVCCRVSFGIMNGFWRCRCGLELEITVDGAIVNLPHYSTGQPEEVKAVPTPDEEFLKQCGITTEP